MTTTFEGMRDHARRDVYRPGSGLTPVRRFINLNRRLSAAIERRLPQAKDDLYARFDTLVAEYQRIAPNGVIADVGGGRTCSFAGLIDRCPGTKLIAIDISAEELSFNHDADETLIGDVNRGLPLSDGEAGLIVSRTLLEHVADNEAFIRDSSRALAKGGYAIHLVPCRNAPFAVVARVMPFALAKWLLHFFRPETTGLVEFPVFYDKCTFSEMKRTFKRHGFRSVTAHLSYYQSDYFDAFLPAYLASATYELTVRTLGRKDLAAYMLVIAQK
ncbi:MAG TPA: methyltransferase domain-containing protein [Dehalococcoidia bacterium]|nr:methyltransferase domain-containing protein [Dehalococcoidia bacterium]